MSCTSHLWTGWSLKQHRVLTRDVGYSVHKGQNSLDDNLHKSDVQVDIYLKLLLIKLNPVIFLLIYSFQRISWFVILNRWLGEYLLFLFIHYHLFLEGSFILKIYQMLHAIWYHLNKLENVKNTHGGMSLSAKLQPYFTKSNILFYGCFSLFLTCTNDTKSHNASP